ncbi:MAG: protein-disulfide reductase DsbD family protein [Proteobacteria bacterium]|nr:protein-disulfide reductase DsbD family protein [Pseudomonadota bacterium]
MDRTLTSRSAARRCILLVAFALALLARPVFAAPDAASDWAQNEFGMVRLVAATAAVGEGETVRLGLDFRMAPHWKVYWRSPGAAGYPPRLDFAGSENLADTAMRWPAPSRFSVLGLETLGYEDQVVFPVVARLERAGEALALKAKLDYLTCEEICVPITVDLALTLPAGPAEPSKFAHLIERFDERVPGDGQSHGIGLAGARLTDGEGASAIVEVTAESDLPFDAPDLFVEGPALYAFDRPEVRLEDGGRRAVLRVAAHAATKTAPGLEGELLTFTLVDGARVLEAALAPERAAARPDAARTDWLAILGLALLGGLILNLMPCVLPVLSLKLLSVVKLGGAERVAVRRGFLATSAGILASFLVLAGVLVGLKTAGVAIGWGIQFQQPVFLGAMALVVALFAANLWGLFEIRLPGFLGGRLASAGETRSLGGHFMTGALATLLATPCSAPFLGTAVGFALARGAGEILLVFTVLGLGLALPYLAVAAFPGIARAMPRPGAWMVGLRRVLGLLLAGTAIWLLWVMAAQRSPLLALAEAAAIVAVVAALPLTRRLPRPVAAALVSALAVIAIAVPVFSSAPAFAPAAGQSDQAGWAPFRPAAIAGLVAEGKTVFVDITADWCVTCQVNKAAVLDRGETAARLAAPEVVAMRGDWTSPDDGIARYLAAFGRYGIPFNAVYGPGAPDGVLLPELLTMGAVADAFAAAGGPTALAGE